MYIPARCKASVYSLSLSLPHTSMQRHRMNSQWIYLHMYKYLFFFFFFCKHTYMSSVLGLQRINNGHLHSGTHTHVRTHDTRNPIHALESLWADHKHTEMTWGTVQDRFIFIFTSSVIYISSVALWLCISQVACSKPSRRHPRGRRRFVWNHNTSLSSKFYTLQVA